MFHLTNTFGLWLVNSKLTYLERLETLGEGKASIADTAWDGASLLLLTI